MSTPMGQGRRYLLLALGWAFCGLGVIGAFVPLMPTTVFLVLALACFSRASPRFEAWLLNHPQFGPSLRAWREHGAVPRRAKIFAVGGMALSYVVFCWAAGPSWPVAIGVALSLSAVALWLCTRPEGPQPPK